jgi:hypothetical protein
MKGAVPAEITVEQIGFADAEDVYQMEDQALLNVGDTYTLALTAPYNDLTSDVLTVLGGPVAAQQIETSNDSSMGGVRTATKNRRWPTDLTRQGLSNQARRGTEWASHHRGYGMADSQAP